MSHFFTVPVPAEILGQDMSQERLHPPLTPSPSDIFNQVTDEFSLNGCMIEITAKLAIIKCSGT